MQARQKIFRGLMVLCFIFSGLWQNNNIVKAETADWQTFSHRLSQSTGAYQFWTTPPSEHVFKNSPVPAEVNSEVRVYAAQNEFEPFQVVVKPSASGAVTVSMDSFGAGITAEIYQVQYVNITQPTDYSSSTGEYPDPLWPLNNPASVNLTAGENTSFWFNIFVPKGTPSGDYTANVSIAGVSLPVRLHVFNFALPDETHVQSQMNFSYQTILTRYGVSNIEGSEYWDTIQRINQMMIDHRLTSANPLWPGGVTSSGGGPFIHYDCNGNLTDTDGIWGFESPAANYLKGNNLRNLVGFPSFMAATFRNNDASEDQRPNSFCGQSRTSADWVSPAASSSPYNQKWFQYISELQNYLSATGYLSQAYDYIANEPQNQADYDAVAWYSQELKKAAPNLKLMVSEEPKPEIYANPTYPGAKIDIWLAHLGSHFNPEVSLDRLANHNEETWIYFLKSTYLPRFNPFTIDHSGAEARFTGWFLWKYRLRGIAYYRFNDWSQNPWTDPLANEQNGEFFMLYPPSKGNTNIAYGANGQRFVPSIRLELLRDGLEDYEYFYRLNNDQQPQAYAANQADPQVNKIIGGTVAYNRDSEMIYNLRRLTGLKIGGEISAIPDIEPQCTHARSQGAPGNYYINFQDPQGQPYGDVVVDGHNYTKIGTGLYSSSAGYGWLRAADVPQADFYTTYDQWFDVQPQALLRSMVINDWGREDVFEYDLPNGVYNVTVGVGYRGGLRRHRILIEDLALINNETTNASAIIRTGQVTVKDKKLTLTMGMFDECSFLNFMKIEAANPPVTGLKVTGSSVNGDQATLTLQWTPPAGAVQTALKYAAEPITAATWDSASLISDSLPTGTDSHTFTLTYTGGTLFFAAKARNSKGEWAEVSNPAFWPFENIFLPSIHK
jgi:hypothetical protein